MSVSLAHAMNTDSARIRPFFRSLFGLSPMNADMSVFMVHGQCSCYKPLLRPNKAIFQVLIRAKPHEY